MSAFTKLDWRRLDTFALLFCRGVASLKREDREAATAWLAQNDYRTITLDFGVGISPVVAELGHLLNWEQQFGYVLEGHSRNLAALHDGFHFDVPDTGGLVLELLAFDKAMQEDKTWSLGLLAIMAEHSLRELAQARRFFALLQVEDAESPLVGQAFGELAVPYPVPVFGT